MGYLHDEVSLNLLYSAADVFVVPSLQENLPNTIMEAMASGTPCVAFAVGGIPELIDHKLNGYLAKPHVIEELAAGISWVLNDIKNGRKASNLARQKVETHFSLRSVAQSYLKLYEELLNERV